MSERVCVWRDGRVGLGNYSLEREREFGVGEGIGSGQRIRVSRENVCVRVFFLSSPFFLGRERERERERERLGKDLQIVMF